MPSSRRKFEPTPEQLALSESRKQKKMLAASQPPTVKIQEDSIIQRPWMSLAKVEHASFSQCHRVKLLTWNLLAQCLVRRELFPTSNCLKAGQREHMLHAEILAHDTDIICLQEVDRLETLVPVLKKAGYVHQFASAPGKKHGCLIGFKQDRYALVDEKVVHYDNEEVRLEGEDRARRGSSFRTRNVGFLLALQSKRDESQSVIVGTTHLFWHSKYTYERIRQAGILVRETLEFRSKLGLDNWPCILAGDFNCPPDDPCYSLLLGDALLPSQEEKINVSRVVHASVDPTTPTTVQQAPDDDEGDNKEEADPDRVITNARPATSADGLLTVEELKALFARGSRVRSAYNDGLLERRRHDSTIPTYGDRVPLSTGRQGVYEPEYTSYTHYWKAVLDYIFVIDPADRPSKILGFLSPHQTKDLVVGLPQKGICGSDHVSLAVELGWSETAPS